MKTYSKIFFLVAIGIAVGVGTVYAYDHTHTGTVEVTGYVLGVGTGTNNGQVHLGTPTGTVTKLHSMDLDNHGYPWVGLDGPSLGLVSNQYTGDDPGAWTPSIRLNEGGSGDVVITLGQ